MTDKSDECWMCQTLDLADSAVADEVPVGAIVMHDGAMIGSGANAPIEACDPTAHADIVALREAVRVGNYWLGPLCDDGVLRDVRRGDHSCLYRSAFGAPDDR